MANPFDPSSLDELPDIVPVFPLPGATLLPRTQLPLNIFEPRYLNMIFDALASRRCIGMVQPSEENSENSLTPSPATLVPPVYGVGCLGRITAFNESEDGRLLINLQGVCRFRVGEELPLQRGYRRVHADFSEFAADLTQSAHFHLDRSDFKRAMSSYFDENGIKVDWDGLDNMPDERVVNFLAMHLPFTPQEKQALLEAPDVETRNKVLLAVASMKAPDDMSPPSPIRH